MPPVAAPSPAASPVMAATVEAAAGPAKRAPLLVTDRAPAEQTRILTAQEQGIQPAVPIKDSVQPEFIVCLEDGRRMKMLKRHLSSMYNMSAAQYRKRWGLPPDYPMVAPNYSLQKSKYAVHAGLGTKRMREAAEAAKATR
jgi:predicted transcriptional regulator